MRDSEALELNPMTPAEIEQAALARENVVFGAPGPKAEDAMIGDGDPSVRIRVPWGLHLRRVRRNRCTKHQATFRTAAGANGVLRRERLTSVTCERIQRWWKKAACHASRLNALDIGSECSSATLCPTTAFSEYVVETILAFVETLGHNADLLHSDH